MQRGWTFRLLTLSGFCIFAVYALFPSYVYYFRATEAERASNQAFCRSLPGWAHCAKLNLGLDLQGGVHLVMGVRTDKAVDNRLDRLGDAVTEALRDKKLPAVSVERDVKDASLRLRFVGPTPVGGGEPPAVQVSEEDVQATERLLRRDYGVLDVSRAEGGLALRLSGEEAQAIRDGAVEQTIKSIRNRADKLGVTEPTIARRGSDSILIQLPGVKDPQHAIDIIGRTAQLEFTMVDEAATASLRRLTERELPEGVTLRRQGRERERSLDVAEEAQDAVRALLAGKLKKNRALAFGPALTERGEERPGHLRPYVVDARPAITGDYLTHAQVQQNPEGPGDYFVTMTFDESGAKLFERLTAANVGRSMAIVLDGKVSSAPTISEKIGGGTARITLGQRGDPHAKFQEAKDLVLVLKAGALPAPVEVREKRQIGKTLGQDTVRQGVTAMVVGAALVVLFMGIYYRLSGLYANIALLLNVLFMVALLALLEATLTLPGMAGIVLTIGMAVDANVLIFERIREELRLGRAPKVAIDAGYKKAFGTIFDSNVTTLIAGVVLMQYGSGPVRGFAVTLIIGLSCSLYTAIVVTRLLYDWQARSNRLQALSI